MTTTTAAASGDAKNANPTNTEPEDATSTTVLPAAAQSAGLGRPSSGAAKGLDFSGPGQSLTGDTKPAPETKAAPKTKAAPDSPNVGPGAEPERPHNPFAELEDDEPPKKRFRRPKVTEAGAGRRAARRTTIFDRQKAPVGRRAVQRRNTASLTVAAIAALALVAVVVSYVLWDRDQRAGAEATATPTMAVPGLTPGPVLHEGMMMTEPMAKLIDPSRTWSTSLNQNGATEQSPGAACIGPQATGQPIPQLTQIRGLQASGDDRMQALHRADAFSTPEEAAQIYNFRANELGGCTGSPLYVERGVDIKGLGNQALGVRVVLLEASSEYHTIILARTGKVVDVVDVVRFGAPADEQNVVKALAQVVNRQCSAAVGLCAAPKVQARAAVPPPGGDQPGFLSAGDIPRISVGQGIWRGNALASRIDVQEGSGCESVDFNTTAGAINRQQRTYLLRNDPKAPPQFGIDQAVLTMNGATDARGLVDRIAQSIESCPTRTLVAQVPPNANRTIGTPGLGGAPIEGRWYNVLIKVDANRTVRYRVAVLSAGQKVLYLRSNPSDTFDFTDAQWMGIALRAGERATQAR